MPDFTLSCPHCGGAIPLSFGANTDAIQTQMLAQTGANGQIAQGSDLGSSLGLEVGSTPSTKAYNKGYNAHFLDFWQVYPRKRDKRKAERAWRKAVARLGANTDATVAQSQAQILAGAIRLRDDPNREEQYTKYAEGWLNGDGWEDEPLPPRSRGQSKARNVDNLHALAERMKT